MRRIKIMADSTCDLSDELVERYDISILPLYVQLNEKSYKDRIEITPDEIFKWSDSTKLTPKTAAVGIDVAIDEFKKYDNDDTDIIVFGISEDMSTTCNVFRIAGRELEKASIYVVDSMNLSTGVGLQVIKAAEMASEGCTAEQIVKEIEELRDKVRAGFVVDTLVYLYRGGRCSATTALVGGALKIKPQIAVQNGKMIVARKYRGKIGIVVDRYIHDLEQDLKNADGKRVFITHSHCKKEIVEHVGEYLKGLNIFEEIIETNAGSVISSHCGPNTIGVLFYSK